MTIGFSGGRPETPRYVSEEKTSPIWFRIRSTTTMMPTLRQGGTNSEVPEARTSRSISSGSDCIPRPTAGLANSSSTTPLMGNDPERRRRIPCVVYLDAFLGAEHLRGVGLAYRKTRRHMLALTQFALRDLGGGFPQEIFCLFGSKLRLNKTAQGRHFRSPVPAPASRSRPFSPAISRQMGTPASSFSRGRTLSQAGLPSRNRRDLVRHYLCHLVG